MHPVIALIPVLVTVGSACLVSGQGRAAESAQTFPNRPIRLVVPWPPGGISDTSARILGQHLALSLGHPVVVDNRPGAGSTIGTDVVAKSAADGYTLLYADVTATAINATFYRKLPFDTVKDLAPVTMVGVSPMFLVVHAAVPAKTVQDLIALAKVKAGTLNFASAGNGSTLQLAAEMFRSEAGINIVHVPFKGAAPAMSSLISGEVAMIFSASPPILPHVKSGALRALATTKATRSAVLPDVPALAELYPGFQIFIVNGILAPAGLSPAIIARLVSEVGSSVDKPDVVQRFQVLGVETKTSTPEELSAFIKTEISRFGKVLRDTGTQAD
ncbi:MAG: tripartite tricarboxylate transporter substrate binding protein [Betaproteobacteria bacterium]|nr:tripartite tricarboxylate transporter substrate binding protein [Betaproteobacteria bacterium]